VRERARVRERRDRRCPKAVLRSTEIFCLLVFVQDEEVARYLKHRRDRGDFATLYREDGWKPKEAVFVVREGAVRAE